MPFGLYFAVSVRFLPFGLFLLFSSCFACPVVFLLSGFVSFVCVGFGL